MRTRVSNVCIFSLLLYANRSTLYSSSTFLTNLFDVIPNQLI